MHGNRKRSLPFPTCVQNILNNTTTTKQIKTNKSNNYYKTKEWSTKYDHSMRVTMDKIDEIGKMCVNKMSIIYFVLRV